MSNHVEHTPAQIEAARQAALAALGLQLQSPTETDTEVLRANMSGQGSDSSVGKNSRDAETAEAALAAGEEARREAGGSMGLAEPSDPRSEFTEKETEQYLAGKKEITLPGRSEAHRFPRAPASMMVASQITNQDILDLAKSGEFPEDLEHSKEDMEGGFFPAAVPLKQMYSEIQDPLDRAVFLKDRRDKVAKQRFDEIYRRELKPQLYEALAAGLAAASGISLASMAPAAFAAIGAMSRNQLANLAVDVGVDSAFDATVLYLLYDYITSDDDSEKVELEKEFKELQKEVNEMKKDSGSQAITDVSANQAE